MLHVDIIYLASTSQKNATTDHRVTDECKQYMELQTVTVFKA